MINVIIWSHSAVDIENEQYTINDQESMTKFLKELLDKVHYSGEKICLEIARIDPDLGKAFFTEVERWK